MSPRIYRDEDNEIRFRIDDDVPLPEKRERKPTFPFDELEVGQSFWVPDRWRRIESVRGAARLQTTKGKKHFTAAREQNDEGDGCRVWRVK